MIYPPPILTYRVSHWFRMRHLIVVSKALDYLNRLCFKSWIPGSAIIGSNFRVGYWGIGTIIHSNAQIGNNCLIAQNVTIGRNFGQKNVPRIGNDVYIGTGSVVFGDIEIGNNVIIGANSVINKNVPNNCTVVGNPMRIIKTDRIEKYYELDGKNGSNE